MNVVSRPQELMGSNHKQRLAALHEKTDKLHLFEFWGENSANEHEATEKLRADRTPASTAYLEVQRRPSLPVRGG